MANEPGFGAPSMHLGLEGEVSHKRWNSVSQSVMVPGGFDCNICLESCHEPVVTFCGHLYCWPCMYNWLRVQNSTVESDEQPGCPVCKASISISSLVPLYVRGRSEAKKQHLGSTIPPRPPTLELNTSDSNQQNNPNPYQQENQTFNQQHYFPNPFGNYSSIPPPTTTSFFRLTINMVREIMFAGIFGGSNTNMFAYPYTNSYPILHLEMSLNRLSIFLFCCIFMCLVVF